MLDVVCPQCSTIFELDEKLVSSVYVTLKCSQCAHVFRHQVSPQISEENQKRWMVKTAAGDVLYLTTFDVLHEWIMEGKVEKTSLISRSGDVWTPVGDIGEFTPVFQVVEQIRAFTTPEKSEAEEPSVEVNFDTDPPVPPTAPVESDDRVRVKTSMQFGNGASAPIAKTPPPVPRRTEDVTRRDRAPMRTPMDLPPSPNPNSKSGSWVASEVDLSREPNGTGSYPVAKRRSYLPWVLTILVLAIGAGVFIYGGVFDDLVETVSRDTRPSVTLGEEVPPGVPIDFSTVSAKIASATEAATTAPKTYMFGLALGGVQPVMSNALDVGTAAAATEAAGGNVDSMLDKGQKLLRNGKHIAARRNFQKVLKKESRNSEALTGLGWTYMEDSNPSQAASSFKRALSINPSYGDAYIGLGDAYRAQGKSEAAYDIYDTYLGRYPKGSKSSIARHQLKTLGRALGKPDQ